MSQFNPRRAVTATTVVWQRNAEGFWESYLVREQPNVPTHMSKLLRVQVDVPVCMSCLSNDVTVVESDQYDDGELICHECGVRYGFLL